MDFSFSEEQQAVQELARQILADACTHENLMALENDADGDTIDGDLWKSLGEANLLGLALPEKDGGSELGFHALLLLMEEAGRASARVPLYASVVCSAMPIAQFGSDALKARYLPGVVAGEVILTAGLQEEGSQDPARPRTTARADGDAWVLDGAKVCVPAITRAEAILVPARTQDGQLGLFMVDAKADGVEIEVGIGNHFERLGQLRLNGVRVSAENVVGDIAEGGAMMRWLLERAQTALCAQQVGNCEEALRQTAEYTSTRKQFGREIGAFQGVSLRVADGYIDIECMRSTLWLAGWRLDQGLPAGKEVAAAKWWACEGGSRVVHSAQHLHGGTGSDVEYPIHRYFLWQRSIELELGGAGVQLERLGQMLAAEASSA